MDFGGAELADVGAAGESLARADDDDGADTGVSLGTADAGQQLAPQVKTEAVDGRIVQAQDGDRVRDL